MTFTMTKFVNDLHYDQVCKTYYDQVCKTYVNCTVLKPISESSCALSFRGHKIGRKGIPNI